MKGVVIAGGLGTRLRPVTRVVNKSILPVYDKPLVYYPILTLKEAGITNILIISGREHAGQYVDLMGSGKELGVKLSYEIQESPDGLAHALSIAEDFADGEKIVVILGDNILEYNISQAVADFEKQEKGGKIFLKEVSDPERFGVAVLDGDKIISIEEKPKNPKSNYAIIGLYMVDNQVWDAIKTFKPSARGELEITDVHNFYLNQGTLSYEIIQGEWIDAGTFDSLLKASIFMAEKAKNNKF